MVSVSVTLPDGAVGHAVSTFTSQESFNNPHSSPRPRSVSNVSKLHLVLPPEEDICLARCIPNCPQLEELIVYCDSKGEGEFVYAHTSHLSYKVYSKDVSISDVDTMRM